MNIMKGAKEQRGGKREMERGIRGWRERGRDSKKQERRKGKKREREREERGKGEVGMGISIGGRATGAGFADGPVLYRYSALAVIYAQVPRSVSPLVFASEYRTCTYRQLILIDLHLWNCFYLSPAKLAETVNGSASEKGSVYSVTAHK